MPFCYSSKDGRNHTPCVCRCSDPTAPRQGGCHYTNFTSPRPVLAPRSVYHAVLLFSPSAPLLCSNRASKLAQGYGACSPHPWSFGAPARVLTKHAHTYSALVTDVASMQPSLLSWAKHSQRENPGLCILVQKALMKSICLAASLSIESAHLGPLDDGRSARLGRIEEER